MYFFTVLFTLLFSTSGFSQQQFETDVIKTSGGDLSITFIGHASLKFAFAGKNIYIDPFSKVADYSQLPKADLVLITHDHPDHFDPAAIEKIRTVKTKFAVNEGTAQRVPGGIVLKNGESQTVDGIAIQAVPAYNVQHKRDNGEPFHPKGTGNGYVITFGDKRVYIAGDTEDILEMMDLGNIDIAFLPMNLPYTMTPELAALAAKMIQPKILYPYHYGETDPQKLVKLLKDRKEIEVRIRKMR
jgi:L-ascorbate metabolism protein UlaG (beta-lactamase superfamily)